MISFNKKKSLPNALQSRLSALEILHSIINNGQMLEKSLSNHKDFNRLDSRDRAFARLLISTSMRRHGQISKMLNRLITGKTPIRVQMILRLGITQLLFLKTGSHAVTHTCVELARIMGFNHHTGLVNAVMRRLIRDQNDLLADTHIRDNVPVTLYKSWSKLWGATKADEMITFFMEPPPLDISIRNENDELVKALAGQMITEQTLRCAFDGDVRKMPSYDQGSWWVQDIAATMPVRLMGNVAGKQIWDLCAAPGGKTAQLAAAGAEVLAFDNDPTRLERLQDNLRRLKLKADCKHADILAPDFIEAINSSRKPDIILLDAPCSSTGTIRRHPDILVRPRPDITRLQKMQIKMLENALKWVSENGFVVFATCSLQPEEGEQVIAEILAGGLGDLIPFNANDLAPFLDALHEKGWARILPAPLQIAGRTIDGAHDGFFIARLKPKRS